MLQDPFASEFQLIEVLDFLWLSISYAYFQQGV